MRGSRLLDLAIECLTDHDERFTRIATIFFFVGVGDVPDDVRQQDSPIVAPEGECASVTQTRFIR
jgi:hypothetical protein